jgi:hypothetical protein
MNDEQMVEVTVRVPEAVVEDVCFMMAPEIGEIDEERVITEFASLAFQNLYGWLSGAERYGTLTQQHVAWLEEIYTRLLPPDEAPSYSRLYNRFNIPYGRSGYIIRVLNERELPHLRKTALDELRGALKEVREDAQKALDANRPGQQMRIEISSLASRELRNVANMLYRRDDGCLLPKHSGSYGDIKTVMVPARTVLQVLDELPGSRAEASAGG